MHTYLPFNRPHVTGREVDYIREAVSNMHLSGDGPFTRRCHAWLESEIGCHMARLTHSCTGALEMAALLVDLQPGDEVIMPSFTFVSTANAFVLRGGVPVFVDVRSDTLNLDERLIAAAITPQTRAIVAVHYAGVACEMDAIMSIAKERNLLVIEDAAQALGSSYGGRPLAQFGHLAATSFHETKNVMSGEGGALLINDPRFAERAEMIREKGTDRRRFLRGQTDKYRWVDIGSSFPPSEITAAFLWAQLEEAHEITRRRLEVWEWYSEQFVDLERQEKVRRPVVPEACRHNAHIYYLLLPDGVARARMLSRLNEAGINAVFHYVPLHSSPAGRRYGRVAGRMTQTDSVSERLIRLPLWVGMRQQDVERIAESVAQAMA